MSNMYTSTTIYVCTHYVGKQIVHYNLQHKPVLHRHKHAMFSNCTGRWNSKQNQL